MSDSDVHKTGKESESYYSEMRKRLEHAEDILDTLTAQRYLDLLADDNRMAEQIIAYWHKWGSATDESENCLHISSIPNSKD
jgi:hypothetical protein